MEVAVSSSAAMTGTAVKNTNRAIAGRTCLRMDLSLLEAGDYHPCKKIGCGGRTRTSDHRINNPALYQLSYTTEFRCEGGHGGRRGAAVSTLNIDGAGPVH